MRLQSTLFVLTLLPLIPAAQAQFGRGGEWSTVGSDPQRSSWVRADAKISPESMAKPGFEFLWKMKFPNTPRQMNSLTAPVLMNQLIGYRGFRALAFVGGSADKVFVVDTDLARNEWDKTLASAPGGQSTPACPGGLTSVLAREMSPAIAPFTPGGAGPGRGSAAQSAVGPPGEGAVTLAQYMARRASLPPTPPPQPAAPKPQGLQQDRRGNEALYVISGSGMLHFLNVHNGADVEPPVKFLPPNAMAVGLTSLQGGSIYAVTTQNCGGAPTAVWVMTRSTKEVNKWESKTPIAGSAGAAFAADGSLFVATTGGEIVHLEAKTLKPLATYAAPGAEFNSTPVVFLHGSKPMVAATTKDGKLHLIDAAEMKRIGEPATFTSAPDFTPGALASWQDSDGVRWLLAPSVKGVTTWKLTDANGAPSLQAGWVSREITRPLTPMVVNGVVFATSTGKAAPATLYALDGRTGKELWNSGKTITSFVHGGGLAGAAGQVYLPTYDGTLYAFGFPIEH